MSGRAGESVTVAVVGIGGYGHYYLRTLLDEFEPGEIGIVAAIDPFPGGAGILRELEERSIPLFPDLEGFFAAGGSADLTVISSPIHCHVPQSLTALGNGCNVLCEKPIGVTVQEADELIRGRDESGRWVMIGYQWSYSDAIQSLKRDIMAGAFGRPVRARSLCYWPRDHSYYSRNFWAGRVRGEDGGWILDSPLNNAMAHFVHNLFYLLGPLTHQSAEPVEVTAELYRAYPIENFDSVACRALTRGGVEVLFYGSHAVSGERGPLFTLEFENATVSCDGDPGDIIARFIDGRSTNYGSPEADHQFRKLFEAVDAVRNPGPVVCGPEASRPQTLCMNGAQESVKKIPTLPGSVISLADDGSRLWIEGLYEAFLDCYEKGVLPAEAGISWASAGVTVDLRDYRSFPG